MSTKVPDTTFPSPEEVNSHPCITASRWLEKIDESVSIISVCQDSNNPSLVIFNIILVGAFLFTPTLKILSVDEDTSYGTNNVVCPLALGHYKNPEIPINTNCTVWHGQLVFDVGTQINNYTSCNTIEFELEMQGTVPQAYGVSFTNQTFNTFYTWQKGILPKPIGMAYENNNLIVYFNYEGNANCSCNIECSSPQGVSYDIKFCPGETQSISLYQNPDSTDPFSVLINLRDTLGNESALNFQSIFNVIPMAPIVSKGAKPKRVEININNVSENGKNIDTEVMYQIWKFEGTTNNSRIWKDWSKFNWNYFVDYDVIPGQTYGYAIKFKGILGDISKLSTWSTVTT